MQIPIRIQPHHKENTLNDTQIQLAEGIELGKLLEDSARRHLGAFLKKNGNSEATGRNIIQKIKAHINHLNIHQIDNEPQRQCVNMLLNSLHSYTPLHSAIKIDELIECDKLLVYKIQKSRGLTKSDSRHHLFLSAKKGGM